MPLCALLLAGLTTSSSPRALHLPSLGAEGSPPIPLRKKGQNYTVALSAFGEEPGWFVLDTGGHNSYVTPKGLARLKKAGAKSKDGEAFTTTSATLGGYPIPPIEFVLDKKAGRFSADPQTDGVIGAPVLYGFRVGIDLSAGTMRLWPADLDITVALRDWFGAAPLKPGASPPGVADQPLWRIIGGTCGTTLTVNGVGLGATLDTGSPVSLVNAQAQGAAFQGLRKLGEYPARFYRGTRRVEDFDAEGKLSLCGLSLPGKRTIGRTDVPGGAGSILGCDVLSGFRLLLDFPGQTLYARPVAPPAPDASRDAPAR